MPELESRWYQAGGFRLHARIAGGGDGAFVLVHGIGVSSRYMVPVARELARFARVYAVDLPGFGRSEKPRRALDVAELAEALVSWLDAAGLDRVTLLGNSFGCEVAVELAARRPERVSHLVLVGPTIDRHARRALPQVGRWLRSAFHDRLPLHFVVLLDTAASGARRTWRTFRHALRDPVETKLPSVQAPTLVVRGADDPIAPQRWVEEVVKSLPRGRLAVVPAAGHALNWSRPRELAALVRDFVR